MIYFDFRRYRKLFAADFETSTGAWNCNARVWLWDICTENYGHRTGTKLDDFMNRIIRTSIDYLYFFRNLAYDGMYILQWLLENGYKHVNEDSLEPNTFTTIIGEQGQHYCYRIMGRFSQVVTIMDSLKTVNMSIENSATMYDLPVKKGHIDYDMYRSEDWQPTKDEIEYIHNDTEIDMRTIQINMKMGGVKFTQAGNARYLLKKSMGKKNYEIYFPKLDEETDKYIRKAYRGGYVFCNPKYVDKVIYNMVSLDKNSMYPAQMLHEPMPILLPEFYTGKYDNKNSKRFPLYIQHIRASFELKKGGIPTVAKKSGFLSSPDLYISSSNGYLYDLYLSNPDLELFFMNYDVHDIEYIDGYMFQSNQGIEITEEQAKNMTKREIIDEDGKGSIFYDYIHQWRLGKEYHKGAQRDYDKRMQNAAYGTFGSNPMRGQRIPYINEKGIISFHNTEKKYKDVGGYIPIAVFVTAWARYNLIKHIVKHIDDFVYCDTDSLYMLDRVNLKDFPINSTLYDYFKIEHYIYKFKCVGPKRYIYLGWTPDNPTLWEKHITCCGADEEIKEQMDFNDFNRGAEFYGKKQAKTVVGGKIIVTTTYRLGKK